MRRIFASITAAGMMFAMTAVPAFADTYGGNVKTGYKSVNTVEYNNTNTTTITVVNNSTIKNKIDLNANSGNNTCENNTGECIIKTGEANVELEVTNKVNDVVITLPPQADPGNVVLENRKTGAESVQSAGYLNTTATTTTVVQDNIMKNKFDVVAHTGFNTARNNTGKAKIITGKAKIKVVLNNTN